MHEPEHVVARFEIVTPMFLGGADQEARTIRPSSIKGELSFWWRALYFSRYIAENGTLRKALNAMHADEQLLFGGPERQGAFLLSVANCRTDMLRKGKILSKYGEQCDPRTEGNERSHPDLIGVGSRYLGYGVVSAFTRQQGDSKSYAGQLLRSCFAPGGTFDVRIAFRPPSARPARDRAEEGRIATLQRELLDAVKISGQLGGLGSRKRRGWGSLALRSLEGRGGLDASFEGAKTVGDYQGQLRTLIGKKSESGTEYPLTAFATETELRIWDGGGWGLDPSTDDRGLFASPMAALEAVGKAFQIYRGWGRHGRVADEPRKENFRPDHDWFKSGRRNWSKRDRHGANGNTIPERANFGLPHNYFGDDDSGQKGKLNVDPAGKSNRRGSPLFFHVHAFGGGYLPVAVFFDNQFLPEMKLQLVDSTDSKPKTISSAASYSSNARVVRDFLDGSTRATTVGPENESPFRAIRVLPGMGDRR